MNSRIAHVTVEIPEMETFKVAWPFDADSFTRDDLLYAIFALTSEVLKSSADEQAVLMFEKATS